jgi:hypothetical protein
LRTTLPRIPMKAKKKKKEEEYLFPLALLEYGVKPV